MHKLYAPELPLRDSTTARPSAARLGSRPLLRGASRELAALQADELRDLQRAIGNRAVGRLLDTRRLEQEADVAARHVEPGPLPASVDHVPDVSGEVEAGIAAERGGGVPLAAPLRQRMESALGADLGAVRVHADARADELSRALGARAFTTGSDIFLRRGEVATDRTVMAHELAHVVQQDGGRPPSAGRPGLSAAPSGAVQCLVSEADFRKLAGDPSGKSKADKGKYTRILKQLKDYESTTGDAQKKAILGELKRLCTKWIDAHKRAGTTDLEAKKHKDDRKMSWIPALLEDVMVELGEAFDRTFESPSKASSDLGKELTVADKAIKEDLQSAAAATYQLALYAAIENPDLIPFAKERLNLTIANEMRLGGPKLSSADIKTAAATRVVESKAAQGGKQVSDDQKQKEAAKIADASHEVGHAWVRLRKYDGQKKLVEAHAFGFYPLDGYGHPKYAVPGVVLYQDSKHDRDADQYAQYYPLTRGQYEAALQNAIDTMRRQPDYKLIDYNCTVFAKQVVKAAGQAFPDKTSMKVPTGKVTAATGIGWQPTHSPNLLGAQMQKRQTMVQPIAFFGGYEPEPKNEYADLLRKHKGEEMKTIAAFTASSDSGRRIPMRPGTLIRMGMVDWSDDGDKLAVYFEIMREPDGMTTDLEGLCQALGLV